MKQTMSKRILSFLLALLMTFGLLPLQGQAVEGGTAATVHAMYPKDINTVPEDFENDLWLQYAFKSLEINETARLFPRRVPQIVKDPINNEVTRPQFRFSLVEGDSVSLSTETGDETSVTAVKAGVSVVMVTYDAVDSNGTVYGACSTVNTAYAVYAVGETGTVTPTVGESLDQLSSYDTLYYTGDAYPLTFTATATGTSDLSVTCNGETLSGENGSYTAQLKNRSNIIGVVATDASGNTKSYYKVVDARKIEINVTNKTYPGFAPAVGDTVTVSFKGITMPIYKLATLYNPCFTSNWGNPDWDTTAAYVSYSNPALGTFRGQCEQWDLAENNDFDVKLTQTGTISFTGDGIHGDVYAEKIGADKESDVEGGTNTGGNYPKLSYQFSRLPDFNIVVAETTTATKLEEISFGKNAITLYNGDALTEQEIVTALGGVHITPSNATNQSYTWSSSDPFTFHIREGNFRAQKATGAGKPIDITATTVDGAKTAVCAVTIVERPVTEAQKAALAAKLTEAKAVQKAEGTELAWGTFQTAITSGEAVLNRVGLTGKESEQAVKTLQAAIQDYAKAVANLTTFHYTVTQSAESDGTHVSVQFPNLPIEDLGSEDTTSLKLVYSSNIPGLDTVKTAECKDEKAALKTLSFVIPKSISGTFALSDGRVEETYQSSMPFPPHFQTETEQYYRGDLPTIPLNINNGGSSTTPDPEPTKRIVSISIDKRTIGGGDVLERSEVTFSNGESAWDVSKRVMDQKGIPYVSSGSAQKNGVYVSSIDGVKEFEHGAGSGWMYSVNGRYPQVSCSEYKVQNGDVIAWRYTTNLGQDLSDGSSTGGGNGATPPTSTEKPTIEKPTTTPAVTVTNGIATSSVSKQEMDRALEALKSSQQTELVITPSVQSDVKKLVLTFPTASVSDLAKDGKTALTVASGLARIRLSPEMLSGMTATAGGTVELTAERIDSSTLPAEQQTLLGNHPVYDFSLKAGTQSITAFKGNVTISLPYTVQEGEHPKQLTVYYIDATGQISEMAGAHYDTNTKNLIFDTTHFSRFAVAYDPHKSLFTDVNEQDWYYKGVDFVLNQGLFQGTGDTTFSPSLAMTRAMFATVLYRMDGGTETTNGDTWAQAALAWVQTTGISDGSNPEDSITREQLMTMLHRYAERKGYDTSKTTSLSSYHDIVSEWAQPAMQWAVGAGILSGRTATTLAPQALASRAEVAVMLQRFLHETST